jgi:hypothetical protein
VRFLGQKLSLTKFQIGQIGSSCPGQICGVLSGKAVGTLLAASPECAQQDLADDIIGKWDSRLEKQPAHEPFSFSDAARQQDAATAANMIKLAQTFRATEKNTPPDFTTNPPTNRNSVFCQKPPRNAELVGINQAQDPNNDPNVFFDPACKCSVKKGSQANTSPLGGTATSGGSTDGGDASATETATATATETGAATATETANDANDATTTTTTATATATDGGATNTCPAVATVTGKHICSFYSDSCGSHA